MGYLVIFKCNRFLLQREMAMRIRRGDVHADMVILKIVNPAKDPAFKQAGKMEFFYFGRLYDIITERKNGDTTCFYCMHDGKEEALLAHFNLMMKTRRRTGHQQQSAPVQALLQNLVNQALLQQGPNPDCRSGSAFRYPEMKVHFETVYLGLFTPPPERV